MAHRTQTRHSTRPLPPQPQRQSAKGSRHKTREIEEQRAAARENPGIAMSTVRLTLCGFESFIELFNDRMINLDADRLKQATLALGLDVQSIALALTTFVEQLEQQLEDLDAAVPF